MTITNNQADSARTALALLGAAVNDRDTVTSAKDLEQIIDPLSLHEQKMALVALSTLAASMAEVVGEAHGVSAREWVQQTALGVEQTINRVLPDADEV